jgi:hypothetical protein
LQLEGDQIDGEQRRGVGLYGAAVTSGRPLPSTSADARSKSSNCRSMLELY